MKERKRPNVPKMSQTRLSQPQRTTSKQNDNHPLPITATLQDLGLLRASGIELTSLAPATTIERGSNGDEGTDGHQKVLEESKMFVGEMRKAMRIELSGDVDRIKERIDKLDEEVRNTQENVERMQEELYEERGEESE